MRRSILLAILVPVAVLAPLGTASAGGGHGCPPDRALTDEATNLVKMKDGCFTPTVVRVDVGETVTFVNLDPFQHAVEGVGGTFGDSGKPFGQSEKVAFAFKAEGVLPYFCAFHPGMTGAIVVGDGSGPALAAGSVSEVAPPAERTEGPTTKSSGFDPEILGFVALLLVAGAGARIWRSKRGGLGRIWCRKGTDSAPISTRNPGGESIGG